MQDAIVGKWLRFKRGLGSGLLDENVGLLRPEYFANELRLFGGLWQRAQLRRIEIVDASCRG
jgi:hypothetical protein